MIQTYVDRFFMPQVIPSQMGGPESKIQYTLLWKLSQFLPRNFTTIAYSGKNPPGETLAGFRVIVAHPRSRSNRIQKTPHTERETLSYKLTVELQNLSQEYISIDVVSLVKRNLRGFIPIIGNLEEPVTVTGSDFGEHSQKDGTWIWTIDLTVVLKRSEGESFELIPEVAAAIGADGGLNLPLPPGFVLDLVKFGIYRSPIGAPDEDASLDRVLDVPVHPPTP